MESSKGRILSGQPMIVVGKVPTCFVKRSVSRYPLSSSSRLRQKSLTDIHRLRLEIRTKLDSARTLESLAIRAHRLSLRLDYVHKTLMCFWTAGLALLKKKNLFCQSSDAEDDGGRGTRGLHGAKISRQLLDLGKAQRILRGKRVAAASGLRIDYSMDPMDHVEGK
jgi:hypothetical protein